MELPLPVVFADKKTVVMRSDVFSPCYHTELILPNQMVNGCQLAQINGDQELFQMVPAGENIHAARIFKHSRRL